MCVEHLKLINIGSVAMETFGSELIFYFLLKAWAVQHENVVQV